MPWLPVSTMMPASSSAGSSEINPAGRMSLTVTCAPRALRKRAAAMPLLPRPTTSTRLFLSSIVICFAAYRLSQLQRCECKQGEDQRHDPEAGDDLGFRPSAELEVMV